MNTIENQFKIKKFLMTLYQEVITSGNNLKDNEYIRIYQNNKTNEVTLLDFDKKDFSKVEFFNNIDEAKDVFVRGARKAKGTTTETGLVESYFANPFGPVQLKEQTDPLIDKYFETLFKKGIKVGQIRTRLAVEGQEHIGPRKAAELLLDYIKNQQ